MQALFIDKTHKVIGVSTQPVFCFKPSEQQRPLDALMCSLPKHPISPLLNAATGFARTDYRYESK